MEKPNKVYIGLGSNQGGKFKNLQAAIDVIHNEIGPVKKISKVYRSPALGFEGDEFNNACILIHTRLTASKTMKELLRIERSLGRDRKKKAGYESRTIDLDILFFNATLRIIFFWRSGKEPNQQKVLQGRSGGCCSFSV